MALTIKNLARTVLPTGSGTTTVYTVPSGKAAIIGAISLCWNDTLSVTTRVNVTVGSTTIQIIPDTSLPASGFGHYAITERITLAVGNSISVYSSVDPDGRYIVVVSGFERDV